MNEQVKLTYSDGTVEMKRKGITVLELLKTVDPSKQIVGVRINGEIVSYTYEIMDDCEVKFITLSDRNGLKIYTKGLQYVYIVAVKLLFGDEAIVRIKHSIDKAIYSEIEMKKKLTKELVGKIKSKMKEIISADYMFNRISCNRLDAYEYFREVSENEKALNYKYMSNDFVTMYELLGEYNYFYYLMPISTGVLTRFDLTYAEPNGVVISYPIDNAVPKYIPSPKVINAFKEYENELAKMNVYYAGDINKIVVEGGINDFIQSNELLYDSRIYRIADKVKKDKNIKAILISGPSSSGKTTTSKKLSLVLKTMGISSLVVSTDDYYVNRVDSPKNEDGEYEFESIEALDYQLFNSHIKDLLSGKEVLMPKYNFITGEKEYKGSGVKLDENQVLIIEGLHAINDSLTSSISKEKKIKIYISPFNPVSLDRHNHISTTDMRLLRRMIRDNAHRGYNADMTMDKWKKMRKSEEMYVYPYQRKADYIINTSLAYEIGVIRTYAEPLLYSVSPDSPNYEEALRMLDFLKGFINIPDTWVPKTSVLREFIGGSYFEQ